MTYRSPVADILFSLNHVAGLDDEIRSGLFGELDAETVASVIGEAGRFATEVIAPLNRTGDLEGARYENGRVTTPKGFREAYRQLGGGGLGGRDRLARIRRHGPAACGQFRLRRDLERRLDGLRALPAADRGRARRARTPMARPALRETYMRRMVSGEWTGTMNLTEPQAGSDLNAVKIARRARRRTEPTASSARRSSSPTASTIFADNIVHLVLARLPDAPAGTRGLSLFLVPKFLVKPDGSLGERNDVRCASIEHKLGIHASPTCVMIYGDSGGATGWLVGEENRGLAAMFVMMNSARLAVGMQGVAIGERAYQHALAYARERRQGRAPGAGAGMSPIIEHPDVQRMLLTMKSARAGRARHLPSHRASRSTARSMPPTPEERAAAAERAALADAGRQGLFQRHRRRGRLDRRAGSWRHGLHRGDRRRAVHARCAHRRDLRGHQRHAGDRPRQRKLPLSGGGDGRARDRGHARRRGRCRGARRGRVRRDRASAWARPPTRWKARRAICGEALARDPAEALAGATPYLRLFGLALGGRLPGQGRARGAQLPRAGRRHVRGGRVALARFFAEKLVTAAPGLAQTVLSGAARARRSYESALEESA